MLIAGKGSNRLQGSIAQIESFDKNNEEEEQNDDFN